MIVALGLGMAPAHAQHACDDCTGDLNGDGRITGADIQRFIDCFRAGPTFAPACACADLNLTQAINLVDVTLFVNKLVANPKPAACCEVTISGGSFICNAQSISLSATGAPSGGTCNSWTPSYTGAGRVNIVAAGCSATVTGTVVSSAVDDVTITLSYTSPQGAACTAQKKVTITKLVPTNIRFDYKPMNTGTSDGLNIRRNFDLELGEVSGTADTTLPTGNGKGDGEYNLAKSRSLPALYVANKAVKCAVRFTVEPAAVTSAKIKAAKTGTLFAGVAETTVAFSGGVSNPEYFEMAFDANTPNKIRKDVGHLNWSATEVNGAAMAACQFATTGTHTFYTVLDYPRSPWYDTDKQHPWLDALEFTIMGTPGGTITLDKTSLTGATGAAAAVVTFLNRNGYGLVYDTKQGGSKYLGGLKIRGGTCTDTTVDGTQVTGIDAEVEFTKFMSKTNGSSVNCHDCALTSIAMTTLMGGEVRYAYMAPFGYIYKTFLVGRGDCNNPFPKAGRGVIDMLCVGTGPGCDTNVANCVSDCVHPKRRAYGNHGFALLGGNVLDGCVGPHVANETPAVYTNASIDTTTAGESARAGTATNICSDSRVKLK